MIRINKTILTMLLLMLPLGLAADTLTSLIVLQKDGTKSTFELATKPQVTFEGTDLKIHSGETDATISLSQIVRYWFETRDASGVTEMNVDESAVSYEGGTLVLSGLKTGTTANVYSTDGRLVQSLTAQRDGSYRLSLSSLPTGVYVVKMNTTTYKIMKR